jgi:hypothetical protein
VLENHHGCLDVAFQRQIEELREDEMKLFELECKPASSTFVRITDDVEVLGGEVDPFVFGLRGSGEDSNYDARQHHRGFVADAFHLMLRIRSLRYRSVVLAEPGCSKVIELALPQ